MLRGETRTDLNVQAFHPGIEGVALLTARLSSDKKFAKEIFAAISANDKDGVERLCRDAGASARFEARQKGVLLVPPVAHVSLVIDGHLVSFPIDGGSGTVGPVQIRGGLDPAEEIHNRNKRKPAPRSKAMTVKKKRSK